MKITRILTPLACTAILAGCAAAAGEDGRTVTVRMLDDGGDFRFDTERIEVQRGDVVRFVQEGDIPHNVQFDRNGVPDGVELGDDWSGPLLQDLGEVY